MLTEEQRCGASAETRRRARATPLVRRNPEPRPGRAGRPAGAGADGPARGVRSGARRPSIRAHAFTRVRVTRNTRRRMNVAA
ncbi:hypothetical protein F8144_15340 [Streptomyces triticiradicis]|uniref:Uncharacterized protein n=1 Tax=Streptomyces triticiradicis TaxID=2651189 RepID=A0A7J5DGI3_9ACTN|nr:hypothetical protein F8144_15340 [Streptomyces triticiradicis]